MRPKSIPFLLPGDHHIPVILVNYFLVSARHCIVMLHNAKRLHELLLLRRSQSFPKPLAVHLRPVAGGMAMAVPRFGVHYRPVAGNFSEVRPRQILIQNRGATNPYL